MSIVKEKITKYIAIVIIVVLILAIPIALILPFTANVFDDILGGLGEDNGIKVPIVMYHSILKKSKDLGKFVITPSEFESDIKYLREHGYDSVTITDLINYVYDDADLPPKPVVITFDDGYYNNYVYATPILEKYEMKAVVSIVGKYTEKTSESGDCNVNYSYVTWEQIKNMRDSGYYEIQNHTYNLHSSGRKRQGAKKLRGESIEVYKDLLTSDIGQLQKKLKESTGAEPNAFTYPFGFISYDSIPVLKEMGFKATLSCAEGINIIDRNKFDILFGLKRKNRPHGISTDSFFKKICT